MPQSHKDTKSSGHITALNHILTSELAAHVLLSNTGNLRLHLTLLLANE